MRNRRAFLILRVSRHGRMLGCVRVTFYVSPCLTSAHTNPHPSTYSVSHLICNVKTYLFLFNADLC